MNLSGCKESQFYSSCHLDKLYVACASPIDTLTCPNRIFNEQARIDYSQAKADKAVLICGMMSSEESPLPLFLFMSRGGFKFGSFA